MGKRKMGLLVMAYGTPRSLDEVESYYTHIRRGRMPSEEQLQDLTHRYEMIGGISPLAKITEEQALRLEEELNRRFSDVEFKSYLGLKHIDPFIEDAVKQMKKDGITEAVSIVLAPHYSTFSVKSYNGRAAEEAENVGIQLTSIDQWYDHPKFIDYWVTEINKVMGGIPSAEKEKTVVIFSAHSLPERILKMGDPYPDQLKETADLIAVKAGIPHYTIGWQSAGNTPNPGSVPMYRI
jgi:ferrochelatase